LVVYAAEVKMASEGKRVVVIGIDDSPFAEKALECEYMYISNYY
jgi:hypothetical protein